MKGIFFFFLVEIQENAVWRERENKMKAMAGLVPKMSLQ